MNHETTLLGGDIEDKKSSFDCIVGELDRYGIRKYDTLGKKLFPECRAEEALLMLDRLANHLLEQKSLKDRFVDPAPIDYILWEYFCSHTQCLMAPRDSHGWKDVGENMVERLKKHDLYSLYFKE